MTGYTLERESSRVLGLQSSYGSAAAADRWSAGREDYSKVGEDDRWLSSGGRTIEIYCDSKRFRFTIAPRNMVEICEVTRKRAYRLWFDSEMLSWIDSCFDLVNLRPASIFRRQRITTGNRLIGFDYHCNASGFYIALVEERTEGRTSLYIPEGKSGANFRLFRANVRLAWSHLKANCRADFTDDLCPSFECPSARDKEPPVIRPSCCLAKQSSPEALEISTPSKQVFFEDLKSAGWWVEEKQTRETKHTRNSCSSLMDLSLTLNGTAGPSRQLRMEEPCFGSVAPLPAGRTHPCCDSGFKRVGAEVRGGLTKVDASPGATEGELPPKPLEDITVPKLLKLKPVTSKLDNLMYAQLGSLSAHTTEEVAEKRRKEVLLKNILQLAEQVQKIAVASTIQSAGTPDTTTLHSGEDTVKCVSSKERISLESSNTEGQKGTEAQQTEYLQGLGLGDKDAPMMDGGRADSNTAQEIIFEENGLLFVKSVSIPKQRQHDDRRATNEGLNAFKRIATSGFKQVLAAGRNAAANYNNFIRGANGEPDIGKNKGLDTQAKQTPLHLATSALSVDAEPFIPSQMLLEETAAHDFMLHKMQEHTPPKDKGKKMLREDVEDPIEKEEEVIEDGTTPYLKDDFVIGKGGKTNKTKKSKQKKKKK